jgi:hypothetical protein
MVVCIAIVQYYLDKGVMSMDIELIFAIFYKPAIFFKAFGFVRVAPSE